VLVFIVVLGGKMNWRRQQLGASSGSQQQSLGDVWLHVDPLHEILVTGNLVIDSPVSSSPPRRMSMSKSSFAAEEPLSPLKLLSIVVLHEERA
jgi:hypothetical protein